MSTYVLTCCSTADMPKEYFEKRNIPYSCFHYLIDGEEYPDDLGVSMSFKDFYAKIDAGSMPTTSQITTTQYTEFFEKYLAEGKDVLHLTLSSGISGTYNSACIAAEELREKYPDRKLYIIDSLSASSGYGLLVDLAADKRDAGADIDTLKKWVEDTRLNINHWFFTTNLMHLMRGGRVSKTSAVVGTMLGICPLLNVSNEGKLLVRQKVRGKEHVIKTMLEKMKDLAEGDTGYTGKCFISNSACYDDARKLADMIEATFPKMSGKVMINSIGTVIGSHTGPGTVALFFVGDKRVD